MLLAVPLRASSMEVADSRTRKQSLTDVFAPNAGQICYVS